MAHPKRKTSKARKGKRRTHYKSEVPTYAVCSHCGEAHLWHRVCPNCGHYRGKPVIAEPQEAAE